MKVTMPVSRARSLVEREAHHPMTEHARDYSVPGKAEPAGVREDERAVSLVEVLVEAQARRGTREEARERGL
jgi:hypothetical protein